MLELLPVSRLDVVVCKQVQLCGDTMRRPWKRGRRPSVSVQLDFFSRSFKLKITSVAVLLSAFVTSVFLMSKSRFLNRVGIIPRLIRTIPMPERKEDRNGETENRSGGGTLPWGTPWSMLQAG